MKVETGALGLPWQDLCFLLSIETLAKFYDPKHVHHLQDFSGLLRMSLIGKVQGRQVCSVKGSDSSEPWVLRLEKVRQTKSNRKDGKKNCYKP